MSEPRHYARHIMLKRSVWHFRMVVPLDLRSAVGLSEVRISLRTGYARRAAVKARRLAVAGEAVFNRIKKKELPDMDRRELAKMIKVYFQQHLDDYEDHMVMNGPDTEERHKESLAELGAIRERVQKSIALRRYDTVRGPFGGCPRGICAPASRVLYPQKERRRCRPSRPGCCGLPGTGCADAGRVRRHSSNPPGSNGCGTVPRRSGRR